MPLSLSYPDPFQPLTKNHPPENAHDAPTYLLPRRPREDEVSTAQVQEENRIRVVGTIDRYKFIIPFFWEVAAGIEGTG